MSTIQATKNKVIIQLDHDSAKTLCREVGLHESFIYKLKLNPILKDELINGVQKIKRLLDRARVKEEGIKNGEPG